MYAEKKQKKGEIFLLHEKYAKLAKHDIFNPRTLPRSKNCILAIFRPCSFYFVKTTA